jgi:hypothetical protein
MTELQHPMNTFEKREEPSATKSLEKRGAVRNEIKIKIKTIE